MSADTNPSKMDLTALFGDFAEAVKQASPDELLAEAKAAGVDTQRIATEVKSTLLEAVSSFEQRKLHAARSAFRERSIGRHPRRFSLPTTAAERRRMLTSASTNNKHVVRVTAKYRDMKELPSSIWAAVLAIRPHKPYG
jgi:hypothetical protein